MRRRLRRARRQEPADINITAFMNLMVILVPFLLITAVFSRITILQLDLPKSTDGSAAADEPPTLQLEVIVRKDAVEVGDRRAGLIQRIDNTASGHDLARLSALLQEIKSRHPDKEDIAILLESDIPYDDLVQMMDTVRVADIERDGQRARVELFPRISIGDAPAAPLRTASRGGRAR